MYNFYLDKAKRHLNPDKVKNKLDIYGRYPLNYLYFFH